MPPRTIFVLLEGVGVGSAREEQGMRGLGIDNGGFEVSRRQSVKKKAVRKGENTFIVMGASVVIRAAREGIGAVRRTWFVNQADVVIAQG